jgi:anaerobic selenocysteine-containing dehydrogenase
VILPGLSPLEVPHYDIGLLQLAIRNVANYSPPLFAPPADRPAEWQTMLKLGAIVMGQGAGADPDAVDDFVARQQVDETIGANGSPISGRNADEIMAALAPRRGPERLLDLMLRVGPYGDAFGGKPDGLTLATLEANPHGVDLGALQPRIPEVLRTPTGKIELAPPSIVADVERLRKTLERPAPSMVLIGRRDLRSNNSWMHNVENLVRGEARCTLLMHPDDAIRLALDDGDTACVRSRVGVVLVPVEVTEAIMPGVVSIPHGWGHDVDGVEMSTAERHAGANSNLLARSDMFDPLSGNAVLNGIPVEISA